MIDYAEKRDFLRMPIDCALSFSQSGSDRELKGKVINLSSRGILFASRVNFAVGTQLDIVLTPSNSDTSPMEARVEVSRATAGEVYYDIACKILEIRS